jgi:F-type H+-transporting ATPase subunit alpha
MAGEGLFDTVPVEKTAEAAHSFVTFLTDQHAGLLDTIRTSKELGDDTKAKLKEVSELFKKAHGALFTK